MRELGYNMGVHVATHGVCGLIQLVSTPCPLKYLTVRTICREGVVVVFFVGVGRGV